MELHPLDRKSAMAQRHDFTVVALASDLETCRKRTSLDDKRVVSASFERRGQIRKKRAPVMPDHGCFPMHETGSADHLSAIGFRDALMSETDAQDWNLGPESQDDFFADPRFPWRARAGGNADVLRS